MYAEISAALNSTKTALTLAKSAQGLSNYNELVAAISEVNTKLMDATTVALASQEKQSELNGRIAKLEERLREIEGWDNQMKRYKLYQFPETETFAYILREELNFDEPIHYLCATCVEDKKKSILQPHGGTLVCPICNTSIRIRPAQKPRRPKAISSIGPSWR